MIKKISNLVLTETPTQKDAKWNRVLAQRNRLLRASDWTQLLDSGLTEFSVVQWKEWRNQLKNIHRTTHDKLEETQSTVTRLEASQPSKTFKEYAANNTIEDYKLQLKKLLYKKHHEKLEEFFIDNGSRDSIIQKYEESVNYLTEKFPRNNKNYFPFITVKTNIDSCSEEDAANSFIATYKNYMIFLVNAEKIYQTYMKRISNMKKISDRDNIVEEIFSWFGV